MERAVTARTRAIMVVHLYGRVCWDECLKDVAARYGLTGKNERGGKVITNFNGGKIMFTKEDNEIEPKDFCIDNADKANWAIEKIKEERERLSLFEQVAKNKIGELEQQIIDQKEKCNQRTANLLEKLNIYLDTVPFKKSKTQYEFELPAGKLVRKLSKRKRNRRAVRTGWNPSGRGL